MKCFLSVTLNSSPDKRFEQADTTIEMDTISLLYYIYVVYFTLEKRATVQLQDYLSTSF